MQNTANIETLALIKTAIGKRELDVSNRNEI